ncbi:hypothetical protein HDU77_011230 [Chytriomyces hyalinus]|nr:hypothetical protein HDU77_011230 [Chytriomyces hyalinus]
MHRFILASRLSAFVAVLLTALSAQGAHGVVIKVGGASFPSVPYTLAARNFSSENPVTVAYSGSNSGTGQKNAFNGEFQVGASDVPISTSLYGSNGTIIALPAIAGGLVVTYNVPGLPKGLQLKFSRQVLPRIFDGSVSMWNDPLLVADNPSLAEKNAKIIVITRSSGSGSTIFFTKSLKLMDASSKYPSSPYENPKFTFSMNNSVMAATTDSAAVIVGSFPYTLTYLSQNEAAVAKASSNGDCSTALAQHLNGDFIPCNLNSLGLAVKNVPQDNIDSLNYNSEGLNTLDVDVPGAYPLTIISNFILRPSEISSDKAVTVWALKFIWYFISHPEFATSQTFVSLYQTPIGERTLSRISSITQRDEVLYGKSVCDPLPDGSYLHPCVNGFCEDLNPFQDSSAQCTCEYGFGNYDHSDCSEVTPYFSPVWTSYVKYFFMATAVLVVGGMISQLIRMKADPDVKAMSPPCCAFILSGFLLAAISILFHATSPTHSTCVAHIVTASIAFGMVFSMIFLKSIRIFFIFRYTRLARLGIFQDAVLIALASILAIIDGIIAGVYTQVDKVGPRIQDLAGSSKEVWVCGVESDGEGSSRSTISTLLIVLLAFNGLLVVLCLMAGHLTRSASRKFDESKKIWSMVSVCALILLISMSVMLGLPSDTEAMLNLKNVLFSGTVWLLSILSPIILFGPSLLGSLQTHVRESSLGQNTGSIQSGENSDWKTADVGKSTALLFNVGVKAMKALAIWDTALIILMPDMNMAFIMKSETHIFTKFSRCKVKPVATTTKDAQGTFRLEMVLDKNSDLLEFATKEKMDEFRSIHTQCIVNNNMKRDESSGIRKRGSRSVV